MDAAVGLDGDRVVRRMVVGLPGGGAWFRWRARHASLAWWVIAVRAMLRARWDIFSRGSSGSA